jgi:hypothetical protein
MFLIPIASVTLLIILWWTDQLPQPYIVAACVLVGLAGQLLAPAYSLAWVGALLPNVGAAIYMAILLKLRS